LLDGRLGHIKITIKIDLQRFIEMLGS
jgi:hypothetical protein